MNKVDTDALIAKYAEYATFLEGQIAKNAAFLNANGKPVDPADITKGGKFITDIAALKLK